MAATYSLTKAAANKPDIMIQAGVAGTLHEYGQLGQVLLVVNDRIGDAGVTEKNFQSLFDMQLANPEGFPWQRGMLSNDDDLMAKVNLSFSNGVTVNEITTSKERITYYREAFNADVETMEGAALHYVGLMEKISFLQIRSVSNFIGERDKSKWKMEKAITNLNRELQRILQLFQS